MTSFALDDYFYSTGQDITERKHAEQALKASEERLNYILRASNDIIVMYDLDGKYMYYNGPPEFGLTQDDVLGKTPYDFFDTNLADMMTSQVQQVIKSGESLVTEKCVPWQNATLWFLDEMYPVCDANANVIGTTLFSKNITERKKAEQEIKMYELITTTVNDTMSFVDTDYRYRTVNEAYSQFSHLPKEDIIGKTVADIVGQTMFEEQIQPHLDACFSGEDVHYQLWVNPPAKGRRYMDMHYYPLRAEDGTVLGAVPQGHDMTAFKAMEDQLREANATKDTFFSIIAHDLKNPLIGFQSGVELLVKHFQDSDDTLAREISGELHKCSNQVYELLEQLLAWARSQQGRLPYEPMPLNLHALAHHVAELVRDQSAAKHLAIQCLVAEDVQVYAALNMVETVLRNLLSNAIKFTNQGGAITMDARDAGEMVEVSVSDTGVGMPEAKRQRLFRIGEENISSTGTDGERGTGLGLLLCKEFIHRHGGDIRVESDRGKGSTFTFTLPKAARGVICHDQAYNGFDFILFQQGDNRVL